MRLFSGALQLCLSCLVQITYLGAEKNEDNEDGAKYDQHYVHGGV